MINLGLWLESVWRSKMSHFVWEKRDSVWWIDSQVYTAQRSVGFVKHDHFSIKLVFLPVNNLWASNCGFSDTSQWYFAAVLETEVALCASCIVIRLWIRTVQLELTMYFRPWCTKRSLLLLAAWSTGVGSSLFVSAPECPETTCVCIYILANKICMSAVFSFCGH